mmetsp:Transcript_84460/g.185341  ORF Transcript_84460/g.185341 Transcript_84460/m.185341 type:complete len:222 (+) Transcript_84460:123-788(+)
MATRLLARELQQFASTRVLGRARPALLHLEGQAQQLADRCTAACAQFLRGPQHPFPPLALEALATGGEMAGPHAKIAVAWRSAEKAAARRATGSISGASRAAANAVEQASAAFGTAASSAGEMASALAEKASEIFGFHILQKQKRMFRGVHTTLNPSLWKFYHRHGYWATRRKQIDFGTYRKHRYHQVPGDGKRSVKYAKKYCQPWMDESYFKPLKNYCRF